MTRIGLVSDTHGLLRPAVLDALAGCDRVLHAGDIGDPAILEALARIAPVTAVRGNNDRGPWAEALPERVTFDVEGVRVHLVHDVADARPDGARVVVSGHSHRPGAVEREGALWVNPGSAGPRRFRLPISLGVLLVEAGRVSVELRDIV